eukprot:5778527-Pleurochrysis_carterae.AAC.1
MHSRGSHSFLGETASSRAATRVDERLLQFQRAASPAHAIIMGSDFGRACQRERGIYSAKILRASSALNETALGRPQVHRQSCDLVAAIETLIRLPCVTSLPAAHNMP